MLADLTDMEGPGCGLEDYLILRVMRAELLALEALCRAAIRECDDHDEPDTADIFLHLNKAIRYALLNPEVVKDGNYGR